MPPPAGLVWQPRGPRPTKDGQVEGILDKEVVGAIKAVAAHPTDADVVYIGAVNGGIWRTKNARAAHPHWECLTDNQKSLSIGALELDPTDGSHCTVAAGTGRFSSISGMGGGLIGILLSTDAGATWTNLDGNGLFNQFHICGVAPRGSTIVAAANNGGVFRTTNTGGAWTRISGAAGTGLPAGVSFALASDPTDPARLYAHIGTSGIFRSVDTGASWTKVSDAVIDGLLDVTTVNVKISCGLHNNVYVAIANSGHLAGLFRSGDGGNSWVALDLPSTVEVGVVFGIHPGGQADIHMSLAADHANDQIVYIGGDRQVGSDEAVASAPRWPNSVGANDYSGRLFRVDASFPAGGQATHITHSHTASQTAPHADSRGMAMDASGDLLETDDGGIYRRTNPLDDTSGDWKSMNGDLQITEFHSIAWDPVNHSVIGGAQDTGSPQQPASADVSWESVSSGDGGEVLAGAATGGGFSIRYSSYYNLGDFRREVYDASGVRQSRTTIPLTVIGGGSALTPNFYTPIKLNQVALTRLIIGAANSVYESDDQGDTITEIAPGIQTNEALSTTYAAPIAYGAAGNPDLLYVGSGSDVFVRTAAHPAPLRASATYPRTGPVVGIVVPPTDPNTAYVIDALKVYRTPDAGVTWTDITGSLLTLGGVVLHAVAYCPDLNGGSVIVGTNSGVFAAAGPGFGWSKLGSELPTVPVFRLDYSAVDHLVLAGTLGRGAWTLDLPAAVTV